MPDDRIARGPPDLGCFHMAIDGTTERRFPLARLLDAFEASGGTDVGYLETHYLRFCRTKDLVETTLAHRGTVLDLGAHWLHQACLYALDGYDVVASDFPITLDLPSVRAFAARHRIRLAPYASLDRGDALPSIAESSIDIILFTEIIEHITFNPLPMWRELHRVLRVGGRIVVTTPNYYRAGGRSLEARRWLRRMGSGITVDEILRTNTYGHHWKEYSLQELLRYFALLSPDFVPHKARQVGSYHADGRRGTNLRQVVENAIPHFRPNLHLEMALASKKHGITIESSW